MPSRTHAPSGGSPPAAEPADRESAPALARSSLRLLLIASLLLTVMRLEVARRTGFGDAEALYASYALFPQPVYLDHPGLIGWIARLVGGGSAPSPIDAHVLTTVIATLVPWLGLVAARAFGAPWKGACATALALAFVPEMSLGLYALSPDLPLAVTWLGALALAAVATRADPKSFRALLATLLACVLVGLATLSKASGALLGLSLLACSLTPSLRSRWRTVAPWAGLVVVLLLVGPAVTWEATQGAPMLTHRLLAQAEPTRVLTNLAVVLGGQLLYVTPPFLLGAFFVARDLYRKRRADDLSRLLWLGFAVPALPLFALCAWSAKAEPHWLAPALLPLALHLGRTTVLSRRLAIGSLVTGGAAFLLVFLWVTTPLPVKLLGRYARWDIGTDLHAWGPGRDLVSRSAARAILETRELPVVVGPHWVICAQAQAAVGHHVPVGCNTPTRDDFDRWYPRERWLNAPVILYVTDDRFLIDPEIELPSRRVTSISRADVRRGGSVVRTIRVTRLEKDRDTASR